MCARASIRLACFAGTCQILVLFVFVCLFVSRTTQKLLNCIFTKFGVQVAHGPRQKPLDFGGNPDHVTLGSGLGLDKSYA